MLAVTGRRQEYGVRPAAPLRILGRHRNAHQSAATPRTRWAGRYMFGHTK
jgi:hypothetical protein